MDSTSTHYQMDGGRYVLMGSLSSLTAYRMQRHVLIIGLNKTNRMHKYYIDISDCILDDTLSSIESLKSVKQLIRDGKLFDAMDKINEVESLLSTIRVKAESLRGNINLDMNEFSSSREFMTNYLMDYVPEWVDLKYTGEVELLEMYLHYSKHRDKVDYDGELERTMLLDHLKELSK